MAKPLRFQHFEVLTRPDGSPHLLGKGAMGLTYKAFDRNLLSLVVVKVIAPELMGRPEARQRFLQEAQSMAKIKHPNVADVFFLGDSPQGVFYAMEFCDGPSMQEYVEERGPMDPGDVLTLGLQAAQALQAVERHNLIHRDIKPSNMILVNDAQGRSQIKLIDFGLARDILRDARDPTTSQGSFVGTPTFASPEQLLEQDDLDIRSDIYSLGITLWFMLSGRSPFGGSQFEVMFHHVNTPPPWDRLPVMPEASLGVLRRMIEKSPDERFQNPGELARELERVIESRGIRRAAPRRALQLGAREVTGIGAGDEFVRDPGRGRQRPDRQDLPRSRRPQRRRSSRSSICIRRSWPSRRCSEKSSDRCSRCGRSSIRTCSGCSASRSPRTAPRSSSNGSGARACSPCSRPAINST